MRAVNPPGALSPGFVEAAGEWVRRRTGLVFPESRRCAFEAGLLRALRRAGLAEDTASLASLDADPAFLDDLVGEITVGETYFFREPQQFSVIRNIVVPSLLAHRPPDQALRIWSAGCATGEESYSLAILMRELGLETAAHIVATDLSRAALAAARRASYTQWSLRGASEEMLRSYFRRVGPRFELAPDLRAAVEFGYLNLASDSYPSLAAGIWGMDLILCRNVLIYFDLETIARVATRLFDSLSDRGWLLLGASDPSLGELIPCEVEITESGLAYRRRRPDDAGARAQGPDGWPRTAAREALPRPPEEEMEPPSLQPEPPLLEKHDPPGTAAEQEIASGFAEAALAYALGDHGRATRMAEGCLQLDQDDPAIWALLVRALINRGGLEAAGRRCLAGLERHHSSAELHYLHATLLAEARHYREAAAAARRALYLDRRMVAAHLALGTALARLEDLDGARRAFRNAADLLAGLAPEEVVPASDGEQAGRLGEMVKAQLRLLETGTG
jgi:chemotaxis protein methyltransferase CheR